MSDTAICEGWQQKGNMRLLCGNQTALCIECDDSL